MTKANPRRSFGPIEKLFYRRSEAAFALGVSLRRIDYLTSEQTLRTCRDGRKVLIPAEDVKRFAAEIIRTTISQGAAASHK